MIGAHTSMRSGATPCDVITSWDCSTLPSSGSATRSAGRPVWRWPGHPAAASDLMSTAGGLCDVPLARCGSGSSAWVRDWCVPRLGAGSRLRACERVSEGLCFLCVAVSAGVRACVVGRVSGLARELRGETTTDELQLAKSRKSARPREHTAQRQRGGRKALGRHTSDEAEDARAHGTLHTLT